MSNTGTTKFPEDIKVSVVFTIRVNSQDERDSYIDPVTNLTSPAFMLDLVDQYVEYSSETITEMNGLNFAKLDELNRLNSGL